MPPSASARDGTSQLAADAGWYVNREPSASAHTAPTDRDDADADADADAPYWRALSDSDSRAAPTRRDADAHSSCDASTRRASTPLEPLPTRHRTVDASRTTTPDATAPIPPTDPTTDHTDTDTDTRVPPRSGPSGGDTPTAASAPW